MVNWKPLGGEAEAKGYGFKSSLFLRHALVCFLRHRYDRDTLRAAVGLQGAKGHLPGGQQTVVTDGVSVCLQHTICEEERENKIAKAAGSLGERASRAWLWTMSVNSVNGEESRMGREQRRVT